MKTIVSRVAGFALIGLLPAVAWALLTPGIDANEPIRSDARAIASFRFVLAIAFGIFFMYEYRYMIKIYSMKAKSDPHQLMSRLELLKQRERMTAFRWITLGALSFCAFPLFDYKPEENANWSEACQDNILKVSRALTAYYNANGSFPPAYIADSSGKPMHGWRVLILPYLGEEDLYRQYNFSEPWDGPHNALLAAKIPDAFVCPVRNSRYKSWLAQWIWRPIATTYSNYAMLSGAGTPFQKDRAPKKADFVDGMDRTLLLVENSSARNSWLKPGDITCNEFSKLPPSKLLMHGSRSDIFHACCANGAVTTLPSTISPKERAELAQSGDGLPRKMVAN